MDVIVKGIDAPTALQKLYDATQPLGLGVLHARGPLTRTEAEELLRAHERQSYDDDKGKESSFDYVFGRPLKVTIKPFTDGAILIKYVDLLDRDAPGGEGAARRALESAGGVVTSA